MNRVSTISIGVLCATMMSAPAAADLLGLVVFREEAGGPGPAPPGPERWIYRVYAEFSSPNHTVLGWGAGGALGSGQIVNITADSSLGSGFTNIPNDDSGNLAPQLPGTARDWDTYMTVGLLYGQEGLGGNDYAGVINGTPTFISDGATSWVGTQFDIGVALFPPEPDWTQGRSDYRINGFDTDTRVLLMQLVVNAGEHVAGTIGVSWRVDGGTFQITEGLSFTSVPAPATGVILLVWLLQSHRRSRCRFRSSYC